MKNVQHTLTQKQAAEKKVECCSIYSHQILYEPLDLCLCSCRAAAWRAASSGRTSFSASSGGPGSLLGLAEGQAKAGNFNFIRPQNQKNHNTQTTLTEVLVLH